MTILQNSDEQALAARSALLSTIANAAANLRTSNMTASARSEAVKALAEGYAAVVAAAEVKPQVTDSSATAVAESQAREEAIRAINS